MSRRTMLEPMRPRPIIPSFIRRALPRPRSRFCAGRLWVGGAPVEPRYPRDPIAISRRAHDQEADLRHVLDREAQAFASEARVLHAAVRHVVDAEARRVADDDAADLE